MPNGNDTYNPPPGYTGPAATSGGGEPPDPAQWNTDQWWTTPDLMWDSPTSAFLQGGQIASPELPAWAGQPGQYADPRAFYSEYWGQPDDMRETWLGQLQSQGTGMIATEEARQAALASIADAISGVRAEQAGWETDPYRAMVMRTLGELATSERPVFSEREEAARSLDIAQTVAQNLAQAQARAAGRGVASGGAAGGIEAGIRGQGMAAGTRLGALVDAANVEGRQRALSSLGRLTGAYEQLDQSYLDAINQLTRFQAGLEADVHYEPQDLYAFKALAFEREKYEQALQMEQQALEAWREAQSLDWTDALDFLSVFV